MWTTLATLSLLAAEPTPPPPLRDVVVPAGLRAVTSNPEFSGIAWAPHLKRYLVVTDDSGFKDAKSNHQPLLLALDENGVLDEAPVPILGVRKLNDPESICPGPKGTFFLVTSHSPNKKGETPGARRQLLHLEPAKRGLRAIGALDLSQAENGKSLLEIAGLPKDAILDIEAITYRDRALYIGLKSPLSAKKEAILLRLESPEKSLHNGGYPAATLSVFAKIPLCVKVDGAEVCEGISDLLFLHDGSLALVANAPKGGPTDKGGSLWRLPSPGKSPAAELLHRFPGRKPEGLAYTPDQKGIVVVFDTDQGTPVWVRLPRPGGEGPH